MLECSRIAQSRPVALTQPLLKPPRVKVGTIFGKGTNRLMNGATKFVWLLRVDRRSFTISLEAAAPLCGTGPAPDSLSVDSEKSNRFLHPIHQTIIALSENGDNF